MEAKVKIQKWGNDFGINIPPAIVNELSLKEGLYVSIQNNKNKIIAECVKSDSYNLTDMLSVITDDNLHQSIEWGMPVGNEIW